MKILINALSGIGDALMFTPSLVKLREIYPGAEIDAMVMYKGVEQFYKRLDEINNVYFYDFLNSSSPAALKFIFGLRRKRYDISFNVYPSNRKEYNIINFMLGAKKRAGVRYLRADRQNLGYLNNYTVKENDDLHNVEENIRLVEKVSGKKIEDIPPLKFPLYEDDKKYGEKYLKDLGIDDSPILIGFHPGCSTLKNHIKRRWEPAKFAGLAMKLVNELNAKVLLFGGPDEKELREEIIGLAGKDKNIISADTGSLVQSAAVMAGMDVFVSNDSGLMHVAAALGLKTAAIIGPTSPAYIHPWKTEHKIVSLDLDCMPCFVYSPAFLKCYREDVQFKCLRELSVEHVYNEVKELAGITG